MSQNTGADVGEFRNMQTQQLRYLSAGARSLEEAMGQGAVPGIMDDRKELFLNLKRFKETCPRKWRQ
jgi:hypothetical protein